MSRLSYGVAAQRAQSAMYTVDVVVDCPSCGERMLCVVYGTDVEIDAPCINGCSGESDFNRDAMNDDALAQAASEREAYITHLRECGA